MNAQLQARLTTLERAIDTLVDSITSYNPSTSAAQTLVAVDDDLNRDLETLAQHQKNYKQLDRLRQTTEALDQQIKDSLNVLADTRRELVTSRPRQEERQLSAEGVEYKKLLATAQRIAKYTTPPKKAQDAVVKSEGGAERGLGDISQATDTQETSNGAETAEVQTPTKRAMDKIAPHLHAWIDPPQGADGQPIFTPWPNENVIRSGALGLIQRMIEDGQDPDAFGEVGDVVVRKDEEVGPRERTGEQPRIDSGLSAEEMARRQDEKKRLQEQERQKQAATFDEFDLYDPDAE